MKTAISIPDETFQEAERLAKRLGVSRSELYARAMRQMLERLRAEEVTAKLDAVYATPPTDEDEAALAFVTGAARHTLGRTEWEAPVTPLTGPDA